MTNPWIFFFEIWLSLSSQRRLLCRYHKILDLIPLIPLEGILRKPFKDWFLHRTSAILLSMKKKRSKQSPHKNTHTKAAKENRWKFTKGDVMANIAYRAAFCSPLHHFLCCCCCCRWAHTKKIEHCGWMENIFYVCSVYFLVFPQHCSRASPFCFETEGSGREWEPTKETWTIIRDAMNYWRTSKR